MSYFRNSGFPFKGTKGTLKEGLSFEAVEDVVPFPCVMLSPPDLHKSTVGLVSCNFLLPNYLYVIVHKLQSLQKV